MARKTTKTTVKKDTTRKAKALDIESAHNVEGSSSTRSFKLSRKKLMLVVGVALLLGLLYVGRSIFVVAIINGQPVSRLSYYKELENQGGKQAMNNIITEKLLLQEAKKQNITVSDQEINQEINTVEKNIQASGQTLNEALAARGMNRAAFIKQLRLQKTLEKILGNKLNVTDKEVSDYMEKNKASLPQVTEATEQAQLKSSVQQQIKQQKFSDNAQKYLDSLQKKAKINYFIKL